MATLTTGDFNVPTQLLDPWLRRVNEGSVVAKLSNSIPMRFGPGEAFIFDSGEAELVTEGQNKSSATVTSSTQTVTPHKFQKTLRFTDEVLWADEDHQMGVVQQLLDQIQPALSRALDFGVIHGINPFDGAVAPSIAQKLVDTTNRVAYDNTGTVPAYEAVDAADALVLAAGGIPSDIALDPSFASKFTAARTSDGVRLYPNLSYGSDISELDGHRAAVSRTVRASGVTPADTTLLSIVGDFSAVRWGVQKSIGLEVIRYGDPDGGGDLQRNNQVAFRAEVVYGWGIAELNTNFAKIEHEVPV